MGLSRISLHSSTKLIQNNSMIVGWRKNFGKWEDDRPRSGANVDYYLGYTVFLKNCKLHINIVFLIHPQKSLQNNMIVGWRKIFSRWENDRPKSGAYVIII